MSSTSLFVVRRIAASILLVAAVLSLTFFFVHWAPGDPSLYLQDPRLSLEDRASLRRIYGLDQPLMESYFTWMQSVVVHADWGTSFVHARPVTSVIGERLPATLILAGTAFSVQFFFGIWGGIVAAKRAGSPLDHLLRHGSLVLYCLPVFWTGLMSLLLFSFRWTIFPGGHMRSPTTADFGPMTALLDLGHHLVLPVLVLVGASVGATLRFARTSLLSVLSEDFIRTARAAGVPERRVIWVHALRNAAAPLIQLFGLSFPLILSGALVVEVVFSWPGLGRLTYESILARDYPVILAATALSGALVVSGNMLADLLQALADPRVRT